jgi:heat shock protein HtpX
MTSLYTHQAKNIWLTRFYISFFLVLVIAVGYVFAGAMDSSNILYGFVAFSVIMSFSSYWYSDRIVLKMSNARPLDMSTHPEVYRMVENLSITAGLPMPKLYVMEDTALNAFATGRNPEHGVICFTTGILDILEPAELEGVTAHELSHIGNRDTLVSTVVVILVGFIALLADWFRHAAMFGGGNSDNNQGKTLFFVGAIVLSLLAPLAGTILQLAISRKRELLADASGALLTRYPEGLARALEKISGDTEPLEAANRATAHLYISNPLKGKTFSRLFMTHPPVEERLAALRSMEA